MKIFSHSKDSPNFQMALFFWIYHQPNLNYSSVYCADTWEKVRPLKFGVVECTALYNFSSVCSIVYLFIDFVAQSWLFPRTISVAQSSVLNCLDYFRKNCENNVESCCVAYILLSFYQLCFNYVPIVQSLCFLLHRWGN